MSLDGYCTSKQYFNTCHAGTRISGVINATADELYCCSTWAQISNPFSIDIFQEKYTTTPPLTTHYKCDNEGTIKQATLTLLLAQNN